MGSVSDSEREAMAAQASLTRMQIEGIDAALISAISKGDSKQRIEVIKIVYLSFNRI